MAPETSKPTLLGSAEVGLDVDGKYAELAVNTIEGEGGVPHQIPDSLGKSVGLLGLVASREGGTLCGHTPG